MRSWSRFTPTLLLRHGADPNHKCSCRNTSLERSIEKKIGGITKLLLANGADTQNESLHLAARFGCSEGCKILIDHGFDVNARDNYVVENSLHFEESECLLSFMNKASRQISKIRGGFTPLHYAAQNGHVEVASILLDYGHDVDALAEGNLTPLHYAVQNMNDIRGQEVVNVLIRNGANVNAVAQCGLTPLHVAASKGYVGLLRTLLKNGADVELNYKGGMTPLHIAARSNDQAEIVDNLIRCSLDVSARDDRGETALILAIRKRNPRVVSELLSMGADVDVTTRKGETSLEYAICKVDRYFHGRLLRAYVRSEKVTEIVSNIEFHLIKLKMAGLRVSEKNLRTVDDVFNCFEKVIATHGPFLSGITATFTEQKRVEFSFQCREELKEIKSRKLDIGLSLHDILTTDNPRYILNETLVRELESIDYERFPLYGSLIESKIEMDRRRISLLEPGVRSFWMLMKMFSRVELKRDIVRKILFKLAKQDLKNLILCGERLINLVYSL